MKKKTKGIMAFAFLGGIMVTSGVVIGIPGIVPQEELTLTGTPADNFPDAQRPQFCESGGAKSNSFVREFKIPTECTQPLAITTDPQGNVWFAQTNTGKVAKFDPISETFTEYENPQWRPMGRSMMWGIDYSPDATIWFTDDTDDSVWKFSIEDEQYQRIQFPSDVDSLPQRLEVKGSQIVVNDFTGSKLSFFDPTDSSEVAFENIPSQIENSVTGAFAFDSQGNVWYTIWVFQQGGILVKFDKEQYNKDTISIEELLDLDPYMEAFQLPRDLSTPNGIISDNDGLIWLAGTSSSLFFNFDPATEIFTKYKTSDPPVSTYGNFSGLIKSPITRPYWLSMDDNGKIVFNEQTANRIGIFDPKTETFVEYMIPSKNPNWGDCELSENCGLAQVFDFEIQGEKIWFTEWVENNIGVLDTSKQLPFEIELESTNVVLEKDGEREVTFKITGITGGEAQIITSDTSQFSDLVVTPNINRLILAPNETKEITIRLGTGINPLSTTHKVLLGAQNDEVSISKYLTVTILP